jgi:hypothetical protein
VAYILNQHNTELKSCGVLFSIHEEDIPSFACCACAHAARRAD